MSTGDTKKKILATLTSDEKLRAALLKVALRERVAERSVAHGNGIYEEGPFLGNLAQDILKHSLTKQVFADFTEFRMKMYISSKIRSGELSELVVANSAGVRFRDRTPMTAGLPEKLPLNPSEAALQKSIKATEKYSSTLTSLWNETHGDVAA